MADAQKPGELANGPSRQRYAEPLGKLYDERCDLLPDRWQDDGAPPGPLQILQPVETNGEEPLEPAPHDLIVDSECAADLGDPQASMGEQNNLGSLDEPV